MPLQYTYKNSRIGVSIAYPENWTIFANAQVARFTHPLGTNVQISYERAPKITPDEYAALFTDQLRRGLRDYQEVQRIRTVAPQGISIEARATTNGVPIRLLLVITTNGDFAVVAQSNVRESLASLHGPIVQSMLSSFQTFPPIAPLPPAADDHGDTQAKATALTLGAAMNGVTNSDSDVDYFSFQATQGTRYKAEVRLITLEDSNLRLEGPSDCGITQNDDIGQTLASRIVWTAQTSGPLFLAMRRSSGGENGTYTITVSTTNDPVTDDYGNEPCSAAAVTSGQPVQGALNAADDSDIFTLSIRQGATYIIAVSLGTLADSYLVLVDSDGRTIITANDDFGNTKASRIQYAATKTGTIYVVVTNPDDASTGTYTLSVTSN